MTIETKYNIGQEVWMLPSFIPIKVKIYGIEIAVVDNRIYTFYNVKDKIINHRMSESQLFPTKEELLKSL